MALVYVLRRGHAKMASFIRRVLVIGRQLLHGR